MKDKLAVTWVAAFLHRRGDLHPGLEGRTRAEEGVRAQRLLQAAGPTDLLSPARSASYQRERPVSLTVDLAGRTVTLAGRIDGCDLSAEPLLIEEYKTTRADHQRAHVANAAEHWAQARLYAGLLAREGLGREGFLLRLCYCHPDTLAVTPFEARLDQAEALLFLEATLAELATWLAREAAHERARDARIATLEFPYGRFRPHQHAAAQRVYRALRDREALLLEAPTGSGKTAAVLYPAVRALAGAGYRRLLFLTSRNTGAHAARDALEHMDPQAEWLRFVQISAREKVCRVAGAPCEPRACPRSLGYYDRVRPALIDLLVRHALTLETLGAVATAHCVCPHELALDAAVWCDVVIGDYNYVFDPQVRLQRLAGERDAAVLVDEAHQLAPRVADMRSLTLDRADVRTALAEAPPETLTRGLRGIDRQLAALARRQDDGGESGSVPSPRREYRIETPKALLRALERFVESAYQSTVPLETWPHTLDVFFNAARWLRDGEPDEPHGWLHRISVAQGSVRDVQVGLDCLDPGPWIAATLSEFGGQVRFSGTVSPLPLYQRLHGLPGAPAERAGNPFSAEQLDVLLVHDLPTYFKSRAREMGRLVTVVGELVAAVPGHHLVAFPSFEYLRQFEAAFAAAAPGSAQAMMAQRPGMDEAERAEFIAAFRAPTPPRLGLVVLGGVFGESVDFSGAVLSAVTCVGLGLPPPSLGREALAEYFDAEGEDGWTIAYLQPALVKVVQMAGRLLRGPEDRGVLCLIDPRFDDPRCRQFFPSHWRPERIRANAVAGRLANFWQDAARFPRLRASEQESPT